MKTPQIDATAQACPILEHGATIEVRPIADLCRPMAELKQHAQT